VLLRHRINPAGGSRGSNGPFHSQIQVATPATLLVLRVGSPFRQLMPPRVPGAPGVRYYLGEVAASQSPTGQGGPSSIIEADQPSSSSIHRGPTSALSTC